MSTESEPLLSRSTGNLRLNRNHIVPRIAPALFVCFLSYFAIWIQVYCENEWIQHRVTVQMFGNETLKSNSSACSNSSDPDYEKLERVQQESAHWQMYMTITQKSVALVTTFLYTVYTDVIGRRFLFAVSCFSITLYFSLSALVILFNLHFMYLIFANVVYALTGTSYGLLAVAYSYLADVTQAGKQRAVCMYVMDVIISAAGTLGSLVAGFFIQASGFVYPSFMAAGIAFVALLISVFLVPESLNNKDKIVRPNLGQSIIRPFQFYTSKKYKGHRLFYVTLLFAFIFADMTGVNRKTTESLYQLGMPFCWSASKIGKFASINTAAANFLGMVFLRGFKRCLSIPIIALISLSTTTGSFVMEALASTDIVLYLVSLPACLSNLPSPLIRSTMSTMTSTTNQGALSAGLSVVQTICNFLTGIIDNGVYAATLPIFNGFIFFVFALYSILAAVFLGIYIILVKGKDNTISVLNTSSDDIVQIKQDDEDPNPDGPVGNIPANKI